MVALLTAVARHERRIRLVFDSPLAIDAFTGPALYSVTGSDGTTVAISGLVGLVGMPGEIDLALGTDLQPSVAYTVGAGNVPGGDGTTTPAATSAVVRLATTPPVAVDAEVTPGDI